MTFDEKYFFESITEYDIDKPKQYDMKFGGAKQLVLSGYDGERLMILKTGLMLMSFVKTG